MKNRDIVKLFTRRAQWNRGSHEPSCEEWAKLTSLFKLSFPYCYAKLFDNNELATQEKRTCILLLLDFQESDIAVLLNVKPQRVTNIKKRVNMKLFAQSSATTLLTNLKQSGELV